MILRAAMLCIILYAFSLAVLGQSSTTDMGLPSNEAEPYIVQVEIVNHTFSAPNNIPSGWTTLSLTNNSDEHHLMMAHKLPQGVRPEDATAALENLKKNREPTEWWSKEGGRYGGQGLLAPEVQNIQSFTVD